MAIKIEIFELIDVFQNSAKISFINKCQHHFTDFQTITIKVFDERWLFSPIKITKKRVFGIIHH